MATIGDYTGFSFTASTTNTITIGGTVYYSNCCVLIDAGNPTGTLYKLDIIFFCGDTTASIGTRYPPTEAVVAYQNDLDSQWYILISSLLDFQDLNYPIISGGETQKAFLASFNCSGGIAYDRNIFDDFRVFYPKTNGNDYRYVPGNASLGSDAYFELKYGHAEMTYSLTPPSGSSALPLFAKILGV